MRPDKAWPRLTYSEWSHTCDTLQLWTQVVGKVRLALTPRVNHWWNVTLRVTPRGLTSRSIPYGTGAFGIAFDFIDHRLEHFVDAVNATAASGDRHPLTRLQAIRHALALELLGDGGSHVANLQVIQLLAYRSPAREFPTLKNLETHRVLHWSVRLPQRQGAGERVLTCSRLLE